MKYKVFSFLLIGITLFSYGQNDSTLTLVFDKKKKTIKAQKRTLEQGKLYTLRVDGVNTSYMKLNISSLEKELVTPIPEILKPILPGITASKTFNQSVDSITLVEGLRNNEYVKLYANVRGNLLFLENLKKYSTNIYKSLVEEKIADSLIQKTSLQNTITMIKEFGIEEELDKDKYIKNKSEYDAKLREAIVQSIVQFSSARKFIEGKITTGFETAQSTRENQLVQLHASLTQLESRIKVEEYLKYYSLLIKAQKIETFQIWPTKLFSNKDVLETSISIVNTFSKDTIYNNKIDFYTRGGGGLRLNFSTGFIYNNVVEKSYFLQQRDSLTKSVNVEESDDFDISIGGLAHLTYKFSSHTDIGLNIGLSVSPLDGNTRYLLGGGFLFGKKNKIGLTAGAVVSRINKLSGAVQQDGQGNFVPTALTAVPVSKQNEWGFYFGLTYNILRNKK